MPRKLGVTVRKEAVVEVYRKGLPKRGSKKCVYFVCADKAQKYPYKERSKIVYIGTTERGLDRVAESMKKKAPEAFEIHGVKKISFYIIQSQRRQNRETWNELERDLILKFKGLKGAVPKLNDTYKNKNPNQLSGLFTERKLKQIIESIESK